MKTEQQKIAKELAAIDHEIDLHNITFEQISANLDMVLDIVENCGEAYRNASDTIKKLMNQAIFEKFYISNGPEDEFGVKLTFKAPYDQILDPIKEDLSQINTALKRKPEAVDGLADKAKGHIHDFFGCGPNLGQNKNPYSNESDFFNPNSSSKDLMVDLSQLYSNHTTLWEYVNKVKSTPDNTTESDDAKYPYPKEKVIRSITQHQKRLSKLEIQTICERYQNGASIYKLAAEFGCHRRTISDTLKRNGIEVSHLASKKPELVKKIIELYDFNHKQT